MASRATAFKPVTQYDRRADSRFGATVARASVRGVKHQPASALLDDISTYGCRLLCEGDFEPDTVVWVRLNGSMPIPARVVWNTDGRLGCRFETPIERSLLRSLTLAAA